MVSDDSVVFRTRERRVDRAAVRDGFEAIAEIKDCPEKRAVLY